MSSNQACVATSFQNPGRNCCAYLKRNRQRFSSHQHAEHSRHLHRRRSPPKAFATELSESRSSCFVRNVAAASKGSPHRTLATSTPGGAVPKSLTWPQKLPHRSDAVALATPGHDFNCNREASRRSFAGECLDAHTSPTPSPGGATKMQRLKEIGTCRVLLGSIIESGIPLSRNKRNQINRRTSTKNMS